MLTNILNLPSLSRYLKNLQHDFDFHFHVELSHNGHTIFCSYHINGSNRLAFQFFKKCVKVVCSNREVIECKETQIAKSKGNFYVGHFLKNIFFQEFRPSFLLSSSHFGRFSTNLSIHFIVCSIILYSDDSRSILKRRFSWITVSKIISAVELRSSSSLNTTSRKRRS